MADKNSGSSEDEVKKAAKPLDDQDIKVTFTQRVVGARKGGTPRSFRWRCAARFS